MFFSGNGCSWCWCWCWGMRATNTSTNTRTTTMPAVACFTFDNMAEAADVGSGRAAAPSVADEPSLEKNTCRKSPGAMSASRLASRAVVSQPMPSDVQ